MRNLVAAAIIASLVATVGCTTTQKGAGIGSVIGAGTGAIIGHQKGKTAEGALIGAAAGAAGGALIGDAMETKFCPTCGEGYTGGVMNCPKDGTPLRFKGQPTHAQTYTAAAGAESESETQAPAQKLSKFCPECGAEYPENIKYCSKDGTELLYKK